VFTEIDPGRETWRQLDISMSLHQPATVVLEAHIDCAAVREFLGKKFASESEERVFLISALEKAAKLVGEKFPGRNIQGVLAKPGKNGAPAVFENIFLIDSGSAATGESLAWKTERKS